MKTNQYRVIGVMSGTSLDGIDLCEIVFQKGDHWHFKIEVATTQVYPELWKEKLKQSIYLFDNELDQLDKAYTQFLATQILEFITINKIKNVNAVCSHGHTVFHQPEKGFTKQIGNRKELSVLIGHEVVCDFRVQDVALGGQGAPLVPIGDVLLFNDFEYCLNLGGFANVSYDNKGRRTAFDICPVNIVLNHYANKLQLEYDENGEIARKGRLNSDLLASLNALEFYSKSYPKSLGIEWVNTEVIPKVESFKLPVEDVLSTFTEHITYQISQVVSKKDNARILVTGGGAFNVFLMERLRSLTSNAIIVPIKEIVNYKEALIFGLLGVLKLRNEVNCLSSVTGAKHDHSSGKIFRP